MSRAESKADAARDGSKADAARDGSKAVVEEELVPEVQEEVKPVRTGPCRILVLQCQPMKGVADAIRFLNDAVSEAGGNIDFAVFPEGFLRIKAVSGSPDDPVLEQFAAAAKAHSLYLIAGAVEEQGEGAKYQTSFCFGRDGELLLNYRKVVPGGCEPWNVKDQKGEFFFGTPFQKSTFDTEFGKVGTCIGSDADDEEVLQQLLQQGANLMFMPVAILTKSGKAFLSNRQMLKTSREATFEGQGKRLQPKAQEFSCTFVRVDLAAGKLEENGSMPMGTSFVLGPSQVQQAETANSIAFVVELGQKLPVPERRMVSKDAVVPQSMLDAVGVY